MEALRIEHDSMGEVGVPATARWGAQTQRAVENLSISGRGMDPELICALAQIKAAAARANASLGVIDPGVAAALVAAAGEVAEGRHAGQFPVDVFQTGSGTSTNMNMNEVLANLAGERLGTEIRPNNEPNASQSSNDVFPSAIHLAAAQGIAKELVPALEHLAEALGERAAAFAGVVKAGRTHLMDATPVTLGQEFGGYTAQIRRCVELLEGLMGRLCELPLGGTAVGTGLNAPPGFARAVIADLSERLGLALTESRDHFATAGARDALVEASAGLRGCSIALYKVANDLRLMGSGPRCGLGEIRLPELQPGSSIMPGKVNPVVPEAVCQVVAQVIGNDAAVAFGGAAGTLELNLMAPVIAANLCESIRLLTGAARALADRCVAGIEAEVERCAAYAASSPALATALNPWIGYEAAAEVVKAAATSGKTLRAVVLERGLLSESEVDRALDTLAMTRGGILY
ncbi:MAG: class II fumarate hydratase [Candidatus Dormibacteria bacterium]